MKRTFIALLFLSAMASAQTCVTGVFPTSTNLAFKLPFEHQCLWGSQGYNPNFVAIDAMFPGGVLSVARGGNGTATPALIAGTNISITGTWPNLTINSTGVSGAVVQNPTVDQTINQPVDTSFIGIGAFDFSQATLTANDPLTDPEVATKRYVDTAGNGGRIFSGHIGFDNGISLGPFGGGGSQPYIQWNGSTSGVNTCTMAATGGQISCSSGWKAGTVTAQTRLVSVPAAFSTLTTCNSGIEGDKEFHAKIASL